MLPLRILKNGGLSPWARLVYALLVHYDRLPNGAIPGRNRLAADLGLSVPSLARYLRELEDARLIERQRRGQGHTNAYTLLGGADDGSKLIHQAGDESVLIRLDESDLHHKQEGDKQDGGEQKKASPTPRARRQLHPLPDDWTTSDRLVAYAEAKGFTGTALEHQVERFRNHAAATGRTCKDWDAAFRNWILTAIEKGARPSTKPVLDGAADPFAGYRTQEE